MASTLSVFVAGGTGYIGAPLIRALLERGHQIRALVRPESAAKLPPHCEVVLGNALDPASYSNRVAPSDTFVHLVGVHHPSPSKAAQFATIDRVSALGAIEAAQRARIQHFIYLSVAQPAPVMKSYIAVRAECEAALKTSAMNITIVRPWYVLGPGHRWPYALLPMYWLCQRIPATREGATRLGLVKLAEMTRLLLSAVENPTRGVRLIDVPQIRTGTVTHAA
jgi:uncharacterized protein YbjT (DUF2867 family)